MQGTELGGQWIRESSQRRQGSLGQEGVFHPCPGWPVEGQGGQKVHVGSTGD